MRPTRLTVLVVVLAILAAGQTVGAVSVLLMTLSVVANPVAEVTIEEPQSQEESVVRSLNTTTLPVAVYGIVLNFLFWAVLVGLWKMKKWAVLLYAALTAANILLVFAWAPPWAVTDPNRPWIGLILPAVIFAVVLPSWSKMTPHKTLQGDRPRPADSDRA